MSVKKRVLSGFNNISKSLIASFYHVAYTPTALRQQSFLNICNNHYSADKLELLLREVSKKIGATVLSTSQKAYAPLGASAAALIAEGVGMKEAVTAGARSQPSIPASENFTQTVPSANAVRESQLFHLDKSHIAVHTYPEGHEALAVATFRIDLDLSTCGEVNPLTSLSTLLRYITPDVFTIDVRLRGFTRDQAGGHCFNDEVLYTETQAESIQAQLESIYPNVYLFTETLLRKQRTFMASGMRKEFDDNSRGESSEVVLKAKFQADEMELARRLLASETKKLFNE